MNTRVALAVVSQLALSAGGALAGDLGEVTGLADWSGFYAGAYGGYAWMEVDVFQKLSSDVEFPDSGRPKGWLAGGQIGVNLQADQFVFGVEADGGALLVDSIAFQAKDNYKVDYDWFATVRGRAGLTYEDVLVYATGGVALSELKTGAFGNELAIGPTVGGGLEYRFTPQWSLKAEYLFFDFSKSSFNSSGTESGQAYTTNTMVNTEGHIARAGINFHFGPVLAGGWN